MSDRKIREQLEVIEKATKKASSSKSNALAFLKKAGIVTESGNLSQAYRPQTK